MGFRALQAIDSLRKLENDAEALRREAHNMDQTELLRSQYALQRRLALVSSFFASRSSSVFLRHAN